MVQVIDRVPAKPNDGCDLPLPHDDWLRTEMAALDAHGFPI